MQWRAPHHSVRPARSTAQYGWGDPRRDGRSWLGSAASRDGRRVAGVQLGCRARTLFPSSSRRARADPARIRRRAHRARRPRFRARFRAGRRRDEGAQPSARPGYRCGPTAVALNPGVRLLRRAGKARIFGRHPPRRPTRISRGCHLRRPDLHVCRCADRRRLDAYDQQHLHFFGECVQHPRRSCFGPSRGRCR